ncbi:DUF885 domain-containing protein [Dyella sp.]|uniref:DUF885 domain-containing protein n=1 Tax=Dyella sp. TaxID=1869338 RepID=UPI002ED528E8
MTKRYTSLSLALGLVLAGLAVSATAADKPSANGAFVQLADHYFDDFYFPNQPSAATSAGLHQYDGKLEDYSRKGVQDTVKALKGWEAKFAAIDAATLGETERGDLELVLANIRGRLLMLEQVRWWETNADNYSSGITGSAFTLMARKFASSDERLKALVAREKAMPHVLVEARKNLKNPPKIYTEIALEQLPGLEDFFAKDVPSAFADVTDTGLKDEFAKTNGAVIQSLKDYEQWLRNDLLPRSHGSFPIGADAFRKKLAYDEMVDTPLDKLVAIDMEDMRANQREFARVARELDPKKTPEQVLADLGADHPDRAHLLDTFRGTFAKLLDFIQSHHIVTIPSQVQPILEETPPFMRATTFASMDTPGPFEKVAKEAYFNVTLPEPSWSKQQTDEFMAQFSYPVINNVAVHEAYPGHYVQFLWMHDIHDRVRQLLGSSSNAEGWAHYSEQMMLDEGLAQAMYPDDVTQQKKLKLGQLQDALLRNARFIVGIKMHTGQMSFDQAVDFFVKEGYQSHAVGVVEAKRGTSDPTYLYYTLGKLQILKLRQDVMARQGKAFNLQQFHDDFMKQGFAPIKIVRRAMLHDDSPTL